MEISSVTKFPSCIITQKTTCTFCSCFIYLFSLPTSSRGLEILCHLQREKNPKNNKSEDNGSMLTMLQNFHVGEVSESDMVLSVRVCVCYIFLSQRNKVVLSNPTESCDGAIWSLQKYPVLKCDLWVSKHSARGKK